MPTSSRMSMSDIAISIDEYIAEGYSDEEISELLNVPIVWVKRTRTDFHKEPFEYDSF